MQIFASILVLVSLFKTPKPPKKNFMSTPTPRFKRANYTTTAITTPFNVLSSIVETPTFQRRVKLFSKTGFHLVMLPNGMLKGSVSTSTINKYGEYH
jgi:tagatose-1,6-bisphosphate aldolase